MKVLKLVAACAFAVVLAACGGGGGDGELFDVKYSVAGAGPLQVSYSMPGGNTVQEQVASGSFERSVTARAGDLLLVSGQNITAPTDPLPVLPTFVTATITVNGTVLKAGVARGSATATATCCSPTSN